jgi:NADH:ubiquinone oxidoreductase subunit E
VDATMRRYGYSSQAVIETLHTIQEVFGNISADRWRMCRAV